MQQEFDPDKLIELMRRNGEWDSDEGVEHEDMAAEGMAKQMATEQGDDEDSEDDNGRRKDRVDRPGDDLMFEQFLKAGDYAMQGMPQKRRRQDAGVQNPEEDFDDEELAFKDSLGSDAEKRAKKGQNDAMFLDFMKFMSE